MNINTPEGLAAAVQWQQGWVNDIRDGGTWVIPCFQAIVSVHHSKKIAMFHTGIASAPDVVKVFKAMGWTCYTGTTPPNLDEKAFAV